MRFATSYFDGEQRCLFFGPEILPESERQRIPESNQNTPTHNVAENVVRDASAQSTDEQSSLLQRECTTWLRESRQAILGETKEQAPGILLGEAVLFIEKAARSRSPDAVQKIVEYLESESTTFQVENETFIIRLVGDCLRVFTRDQWGDVESRKFAQVEQLRRELDNACNAILNQQNTAQTTVDRERRMLAEELRGCLRSDDILSLPPEAQLSVFQALYCKQEVYLSLLAKSHEELQQQRSRYGAIARGAMHSGDQKRPLPLGLFSLPAAKASADADWKNWSEHKIAFYDTEKLLISMDQTLGSARTIDDKMTTLNRLLQLPRKSPDYKAVQKAYTFSGKLNMGDIVVLGGVENLLKATDWALDTTSTSLSIYVPFAGAMYNVPVNSVKYLTGQMTLEEAIIDTAIDSFPGRLTKLPADILAKTVKGLKYSIPLKEYLKQNIYKIIGLNIGQEIVKADLNQAVRAINDSPDPSRK